MKPAAFEKQLSAVNPSADGLHIDALSELIEFSGVESSDEEIQRAIFSYMERHPIADLGSPGPLVHFLEKAHPKHISALLSSLERLPVFYTIWMVNRILNSKPAANIEEKLIEALRYSTVHPNASAVVRSQALEFLQAHRPAEA